MTQLARNPNAVLYRRGELYVVSYKTGTYTVSCKAKANAFFDKQRGV